MSAIGNQPFVKQVPNFTSGAAWADVPGSQIDKYGLNLWGIAWQIAEVGNAGGLHSQIMASIDGVNWYLDLNIMSDIGNTEGIIDLGPGGLVMLQVNKNDASKGATMAWRYYKVQVKDMSVNPNQLGVVSILIKGE
jgi:hypothetical protein